MKKCSIVFLLLYTLNLQAQNQTEASSFLNNTEFKIGYYGNLLFDNGLNVGAEYLWKEKKRIKEKKNGQKIIRNQLLFNGSLGYSTNFTNQTDDGLSTYYGLIWRRTGARRWQFNLELNPVGYYRSFLPETYKVKENDVSEVRFAGRSYYAPSIAFGLGRKRRAQRHTGWYLNFMYTLRTPYNAGALPTFALQYGRRFNFKKKK